MPETNVPHAVSHKLYLELSGNDFHLAVADKNNQVVHSASYVFHSPVELDHLLNTAGELQAIYANIVLVNTACRFVAFPQSVTEEDDKRHVFSLHYHPDSQCEQVEDHIGIQMTIRYEQNAPLLRTLRSRFPKLKIHHEGALLHHALHSRLTGEVSNMVAHKVNDALTLLAYSGGKLVFCNQFELNGDDDVFYFVMLSAEQLEFDTGHTGLTLLFDAKEEADIAEKFRKYIKTIHIAEHLFDSTSGNVNWASSLSFALQAAIQCA